MKYWFQNATEKFVLAVTFTLMMLFSSLTASAESALPSAQPADLDRSLLSKRLQAIAGYAADFTQEIQGAHGQLLERSTGSVRLLRPNFKWVVDDPYPQIIVTEGDVLKIYDPDLEQLTIRPLNEALLDTPVSLLTRDDVVLSERFAITRFEEADGAAFLVVPTNEDALYAEIRMRFTAVGLEGLSILDHLGQHTEIRFEPDPGAVIQSSDFKLETPPGTDVIGG